MKLRKILALVLAAAMLAGTMFMLGACNGDDEVDEITIWAWDPNFNIAALEIAAELFNEVHPHITVNIVDTAQDTITANMNTAMAAGTMVGMPNIVLIENYRGQIFLQPFYNYFYSLDNYINPAEFAQYLIPPTSRNGVQFGVPFDIGSVGWYVRTDILAEAGFTVEDVWGIDYDRAFEIAQAVMDATGVYIATHNPADINGFTRPNMMAAGTWYTDPDGTTVNLNNNPILYEIIEIYQNFWDAGLFGVHTDWGGYIDGFNSGRAWSVLPSAVWITPSVMQAEAQAGDWALVPMPTVPGVPGAGHAASWGGSSWYVLDVPGREYAAEFLALTFGGSVDFHERLLREVGALTAFLPFFEGGEALREGVDFFGGQAIWDYFTSWAALIPPVNPGIHTYLLNDIIDAAWIEIYNGMDIQAALDAAQAEAETQLR